MMKKLVLKIGGSLLYDEKLTFNIEVVQKIIDWYRNQKECDLLVFVVGGGRISRFVVEQIRGSIKQEESRHRVGMKMTQVNSAIVHGMFEEGVAQYFDSHNQLIQEAHEGSFKVGVIGGSQIGGSTDMVAAKIADSLNVDMIKKISNISNIYCSDPKLNPAAKPIQNLSWDEYTDIFKEVFAEGHKPGMNIPIDFACASFCKEKDIGFRVCGGENLQKMDIGEILETGTIVK